MANAHIIVVESDAQHRRLLEVSLLKEATRLMSPKTFRVHVPPERSTSGPDYFEYETI